MAKNRDDDEAENLSKKSNKGALNKSRVSLASKKKSQINSDSAGVTNSGEVDGDVKNIWSQDESGNVSKV